MGNLEGTQFADFRCLCVLFFTVVTELFTLRQLIGLLLSLAVSPLPLPHMLVFVFHWIVCKCCPDYGWAIYGSFASAVLVIFSSFTFVRWRFNPFLTFHFHMLRQQSRVAAYFLKIRFL